MSDEGMDLCGDIWNHEMEMRRLLSLLRQSQTTCSDTECYAPFPSNNSDDGYMLMTLCWMAVAVLLYLIRPASIRNRENNMKPARGNNGDGDGGSPPASPAI